MACFLFSSHTLEEWSSTRPSLYHLHSARLCRRTSVDSLFQHAASLNWTEFPARARKRSVPLTDQMHQLVAITYCIFRSVVNAKRLSLSSSVKNRTAPSHTRWENLSISIDWIFAAAQRLWLDSYSYNDAHGTRLDITVSILHTVCVWVWILSIMWTVVLHARSVITMLVLFLDHPSTDRPHFCNIVDLPLLG